MTPDTDNSRCAEIRKRVLSFDGVIETQEWGHSVFSRSGHRLLAIPASIDHPHSFAFRPVPSDAFDLTRDMRVFASRHFSSEAWLGYDLAVGDTDWNRVEGILNSAYELVSEL